MTGSMFRLQLTAGLSVLVGMLGTFGSTSRYSAATYDGIEQIGGVRAWSIALVVLGGILLGCLLAHTHPRVLALAAVAVATWYGATGGGFALAAHDSGAVAWWGAAFFGYFALLHASLAWSTARLLRPTREG